MKIEIPNTYLDHSINNYLKRLQFFLVKDHSVSILKSVQEETTIDLFYFVSQSGIAGIALIKSFEHAMVLSVSDLQLRRGWSPHIWKKRYGTEQITVSLQEPADEVDWGDIYRKIKIDTPKSALWNEINELLFAAKIQLIEFVIENFHNLQKHAQNSDIEATYYPKRTPKDSEISQNKMISENFALIKLSEANRFPAISCLKGRSYKLILRKL